MADQAGPFLPAAVAADAQQYIGSSSNTYSEAMLWAQVSASDACSGTSTFQLPELSSSNSVLSSELEDDLLSTWLANYLSRSDLDFASPAVADPGFMNADLDPVPLPDWNTSAFDVTKFSSSSQLPWVLLPVPDLPVEMQQQHSPSATPPHRTSRSSWQQQPVWNPRPPSQPGSARRELFRPHSAPSTSTHHHLSVQAFRQGTPVAAAHHAPVTFSASAGPSSFTRPSWSQAQLAPVGNWTTSTHIFGFSNTGVRQPEMTLPQTRSPYLKSELLPTAALSIPAPHLNSFGSGLSSMPSWYPRDNGPITSPTAISPPLQMVSGPGESSTPSRKRKYVAMNDQSGVDAPGGTIATPVASREVYALGPALNTNGQPRASPGSAIDPQSVYARYRRDKITERIKTLQSLVPNGMNLDIVSMLDEAHSFIKFLEQQVELLKSDENWRSATPFTYKGIDLTQPQVQVLAAPKMSSPKPAVSRR